MSRPDPLREALARLAEETRVAEATLARLSEDASTPWSETFAAAASVSQARRTYVDTARGTVDGRSHIARTAAGEAGAQALAEALAELAESEPEPKPERDDPLAALFN